MGSFEIDDAVTFELDVFEVAVQTVVCAALHRSSNVAEVDRVDRDMLDEAEVSIADLGAESLYPVDGAGTVEMGSSVQDVCCFVVDLAAGAEELRTEACC